MAVNQRHPQTIIDKVKAFPGPYVGYVKNPTDVNRNGRLFVFIPDLHGNFDEFDLDQKCVLFKCFKLFIVI